MDQKDIIKQAAKEIAETVDMYDIVSRYYRGEIKERFIKCFVHNDEKTPNLYINKPRGKDASVYCYSCGVFLDPVDFLHKYLGVSKTEACKIIIQDFCLTINIEMNKLSETELSKIREKNSIYKQNQENEKKLNIYLNNQYLRFVNMFEKTRKYLYEFEGEKTSEEYQYKLYLNNIYETICNYLEDNKDLQKKLKYINYINTGIKNNKIRNQWNEIKKAFVFKG